MRRRMACLIEHDKGFEQIAMDLGIEYPSARFREGARVILHSGTVH